jgi:phosphatidate phosphatase LPIN
VDFIVNGEKTGLPMKLGEGGEAFFVFETDGDVPPDLLTSPVVSPASSAPGSPDMSPNHTPKVSNDRLSLQEPEFLDITDANRSQSQSRSESPDRWKPRGLPTILTDAHENFPAKLQDNPDWSPDTVEHPAIGNPLRRRADTLQSLAKKLSEINIPSKITDNGDLILDMNGYKPGKDQEEASDEIVRHILAQEFSVSELDSIYDREEGGKYRVYSDLMTDAGYATDDPSLKQQLKHSMTTPDLEHDELHARQVSIAPFDLDCLSIKLTTEAQ